MGRKPFVRFEQTKLRWAEEGITFQMHMDT